MVVEENCTPVPVNIHPSMYVLLGNFILVDGKHLQVLKLDFNFNSMNMMVVHEIILSGCNNKYLPDDEVKKHPRTMGRDVAVVMCPLEEVRYSSLI